MKHILIFFALLLLSCQHLGAAIDDEIPVSFKGRFRPFEAYSRLWLQEIYHAENIKQKDLNSFELSDGSAKNLLWKMHFLGHEPWDHLPLIWIGNAKLKTELGLPLKQDRFSYHELQKLNSPNDELKSLLLTYQMTSQSLKCLPGAMKNGEWLSLSVLKTPINVTAYPTKTFYELRSLYLALEQSIISGNNTESSQLIEKLASSLLQAYRQKLAGQEITRAHGKALYYPTIAQLKAERFYYHIPLIGICIALYALTAVLLLLNCSRSGILVLCFAFLLHTAVLALRCFILGRPPVSNMFETVIYVPWIAVLISMLLAYFLKNRLVLLASSVLSLGLLILLEVTNLNSNLENVQAVLDSQFWLIIHVLMVVGSYGLFALAGILGHFYLFNFMMHRKETEKMKSLGKLILQSMYLGTALLIPGTILGGVWAAQSWGRFWDWDPKESWAFISSCTYLMWIHAHRFRHIENFGLAMGSIVGLQVISFTWYGVNYVLGAGLHSYGFGNGGEIYYYMFLLAETAFLAAAAFSYKQNTFASK